MKNNLNSMTVWNLKNSESSFPKNPYARKWVTEQGPFGVLIALTPHADGGAMP